VDPILAIGPGDLELTEVTGKARVTAKVNPASYPQYRLLQTGQPGK
jgi:hypothetical protein